MTTTPKSVILAVVVVLGLFALGALAGCIFLLDSGKDATVVAVIATPMGVALGLVGGMLASARTTPELPPGSQLVGGAVTLTTPTTAQNDGETFSGTPLVPAAVSSPVAPQYAPTLAEPFDHSTEPAFATAPIVAADHG